MGRTPSSKGTMRRRNDAPSAYAGARILSIRKYRKSSRDRSQETKYQSGGKISIACGSTCRSVSAPFRVAISELLEEPIEKSSLKRGQQCGVHLFEIGEVDLGCEWADIKTIQKAAQIADLVRWQSLLNF